jgi:CDGSH-type Zn-finger protein
MKLKIYENGPIALDFAGEVSVEAGGATTRKTAPIFLCRCGQSSTKPFCDGTHRKAKFEGVPAELTIG